MKKTLPYSTYSISLSFDSESSYFIKNLMNILAESTGKRYMESVPPHLTLGMFHCAYSKLDLLQAIFCNTADYFISERKSQDFAIDIDKSESFSDKVIFLKIAECSWIRELNILFHKAISPHFQPGSSKIYCPENWLPHIALAQKLSPLEFKKGKSRIDEFADFPKIKVASVIFAHTKPYIVLAERTF